jgi:hypothetical protein
MAEAGAAWCTQIFAAHVAVAEVDKGAAGALVPLMQLATAGVPLPASSTSAPPAAVAYAADMLDCGAMQSAPHWASPAAGEPPACSPCPH